jgi:DNA primase
VAWTREILDEIRARLSLPEIVGRTVRLVRHGREHLGCCPFHQEKTPSFRVYDDHYHCFGCGAHGSLFDFVMHAEKVDFRTAVEQLAGLAGVALPRDDPRSAEAEQQRRGLFAVLELAAAWYQRMLQEAGGAAARAYLRGRGLREAVIEQFRLGFAPDSRGALRAELSRQGVAVPAMVEAGLLIAPEEGERSPYDRFRNRVMFPITDARGRIVGFGGRALGDGQPKYLNSPETPLFRKGRLLYGLPAAATASRRTGRLIVVEGYMDVIGLTVAGYPETVAPLGTALTDEQIEALWRIAPEPILCFDPDAAGRRAAARACERALPKLRPGFGLRFAFLATDTGDDPDQAARRYPRRVLDSALAQALPLSRLLVWLETRGVPPATPETRAAVTARLKQRVLAIADPTMRAAFLSDIFTQMRERRSRRPAADAAARSWRKPELPPVTSIAEAAAAPVASSRETAERTLLAVLIKHPWLFPEVEDAIGSIGFAAADLDRLRQGLIACLSGGAEPAAASSLCDALAARGLGAALTAAISHPLLSSHRLLLPTADPAEVRQVWQENHRLLQRVAARGSAADPAELAGDDALAARAARRRLALDDDGG